MILTAEIGSTTTLINAFDHLSSPSPSFLGQGMAPTTVKEGDVTRGLVAAREDLERVLGLKSLNYQKLLATSSAAGGLKMTVHGLVYDMTVRAAREAALGAGAVVRMVTAGRLRERQIQEIQRIKPNIILLAGGVDYGEEEVILHNASLLSSLEGVEVPIIYAGNCVIQEEVKEILEKSGQEVIVTENVYPEIDSFHIEGVRRIIQEVFEEHIVQAPGMERIKELITGSILPTPGAVMLGAELLREEVGDLLVLDVGGATTDVHSVCDIHPEKKELTISPEPLSKRTVEGDLGIFINAGNVITLLGEKDLNKELGFLSREVLEKMGPIPITREEKKLVHRLTSQVVKLAVKRHAGRIKRLFGPSGPVNIIQGKDLSTVRWVLGTGGALTQMEGGIEILSWVTGKKGDRLLPPREAEIRVDQHYLMASLGLLSKEYPQGALALLKETFGIGEESSRFAHCQSC